MLAPLICVSIHATLAGGDWEVTSRWKMQGSFLSTPPSRVATFTVIRMILIVNVSIHATLAGGDRWNPRFLLDCHQVSIHATLAGGDTCHRL